MNPLAPPLPSYQELPLLSKKDFQALATQKNILLFRDLVVDVSGFDHPGSNHLLKQFMEKDIAGPYIDRKHSLNADLVLCHRTVGRLESSPLLESQDFYNSVKKHQLV